MKRIINTLLLLSVAMMTMAQTSFVVADKNGNSQLVQSLVFQQQQTADRFSWKSDGSATGDINDLLFIARAKAELATSNSTDVTEILEQLSGTDLADAEGIAAALQNNPQVEEASSGDGDNVVLRNKGEKGIVIYPMYEEKSLFADLQEPETSTSSKQARAPRKAFREYPKVAIFNFFDGMQEYNAQNLIVKSIDKYFYRNGYIIENYTPNNPVSTLKFTYDNVADVVYNSKDYAAIIIFSHGAKVEEGKSYFCTSELARSADDNRLYNWTDGKYYKCFSTGLQPESNCILYLGVCSGLSSDGFYCTSPAIGYSGKTIMAQANAFMLFYLMLEEGYSLQKALNSLPSEPSPNQGTQIYKSNKVGSQTIETDTPAQRDYMVGCTVNYNVMNRDRFSVVAGTFSGNNIPPIAKTEFVPVLWYGVDWQNSSYYPYYETGRLKKTTSVEENTFVSNFSLLGLPESIYICRITGITKDDEGKLIKPAQYRFRICSDNYNENDAEAQISDEDVTAPQVLGSGGQPLEEITISAGSSQTFSLDVYSGHTFETPCLDKNICTVSLSGTTLTVTGVSEGTTYIGVYDVQNRQMTAVKVIVSTGEPSVNLCPDDHHPHMIDLGLPSGTLWACCNVGASKPEDYGGYFAWGETEEKSRYHWDTYIHCDGSEETCHIIGSDIAGTQYDVAHAKWGGSWVMPSLEQIIEMRSNCSSEWITENGVNGHRFTSPKGASIFLPAAGDRFYNDLCDAGSDGNYWSSTLADWSISSAYFLEFNDMGVGWYVGTSRYSGKSVRPVRKN